MSEDWGCGGGEDVPWGMKKKEKAGGYTIIKEHLAGPVE